jgi:hypothetical protein
VFGWPVSKPRTRLSLTIRHADLIDGPSWESSEREDHYHHCKEATRHIAFLLLETDVAKFAGS